ncbi:MAG: secretin N-terminal domain-containing protein [Armatimonadota bacterium]|nr:secretin N-terminal domain-containing protein [Armatimonadota bacterium]
MLTKTGRRLRSGMAIIMIVGMALASTGYATSGDAEPAGGTVSISVDKAPLDQIIMMLTKQAGIDVILANPEAAEKKISAHIVDQPVEKVLTDILTAAGISFSKTEAGSYLVGAPARAEQDPPHNAVEPAPMAAFEEPVPVIAPIRKMRREKIMLKHSNASDIVKVLLVGDPFEESLTTPKIKDSRTLGSFDQPKYYSDNGIRITDSEQPTVDDRTYSVPPTKDIRTYGTDKWNEANRSAGAFSEAGQTPSYSPYRPGTGTSSTRPGGTSARPGATPGAPGTGSASTGLLPDGIDMIKALDVDNSIIVRGNDDGIAELKELIHMLDVPPKQVEVKAEFIEVSMNVVNRMGIDWNLDSLNKSVSTSFAPAGNVAIGLATGNITANLRAELTSGKGKIVNAPIISTINNMWASLQIGQEIPIFLTNLVSTGQGNVVSGTTVGSRPVFTGLSVLPRINGDNSVTMYIQPQVQDTGKIYKGPDGTEVPESRTQTLQTNRRVGNQETIVVGGFVRRSDNANTNEVPLLSRLPFIGGLFRSKSRDAEDRELLIFLTPRIIQDEGGATTGVRPEF